MGTYVSRRHCRQRSLIPCLKNRMQFAPNLIRQRPKPASCTIRGAPKRPVVQPRPPETGVLYNVIQPEYELYNRHRTRPARASTASNSTCAPASASSGSMLSASLCDSPSLHGVKIIAVGT